MPAIHRIAERIGLDESFGIFPVIVIRAAEKNANVEIDIDEVRRDEFSVNDDTRRDEHLPAPRGHVLIGVITVIGVIE